MKEAQQIHPGSCKKHRGVSEKYNADYDDYYRYYRHIYSSYLCNLIRGPDRAESATMLSRLTQCLWGRAALSRDIRIVL